MTKFTDEQLKWLAEMAGGKLYRPYKNIPDFKSWLFENGKGCEIVCEDWNPLLPEHGWLVLQRLFTIRSHYVVFIELEKLMSSGLDFWQAVMQAALGTKEDSP